MGDLGDLEEAADPPPMMIIILPPPVTLRFGGTTLEVHAG